MQWLDEDTYIDDVGGYHSPGQCVSPCNVFCGECCKETCANCIFANMTSEERIEWSRLNLAAV